MLTSPSHWKPLIQSASTEDALVNLMRDYVESWTSEEMLALPLQCRPGRIRDRDDVCDWAVVLAREELKVNSEEVGTHLLHHIAATFREAASRLTQLSFDSRPPMPRQGN